jgi:hypothetical protein
VLAAGISRHGHVGPSVTRAKGIIGSGGHVGRLHCLPASNYYGIVRAALTVALTHADAKAVDTWTRTR